MSRIFSAQAMQPARWAVASLLRLSAVALGLTTLGAFALYIVSLRTVDINRLSDIGLVSVMPGQAFLALGILTFTFILTLARKEALVWLLGSQVAVLIFMLYGVTAFVEEEPRFPTAWLHAGFVEFIAHTGETLPSVDARFSWPGFFSLSAFVARVIGDQNMPEALRWAPTVSNLLYFAPLLLVARQLTDSWRAQWLAIWLFYITNWVGQDYFSPQGIAFFVFLVFMAILLVWFSTRQSATLSTIGEAVVSTAGKALIRRVASLARRLGRILQLPGPLVPGGRAAKPATPAERAGLVLLLIVLFAFVTISHPLTPFMLIMAVSLLVVAGYCPLRGLPLLMGLMVLLWISYMTVAYWSGHRGELFGDVGRLGSNVSTSVAGRIQGSSSHMDVLYARLAFTLGVWALAAIGFVRRLRNGHGDWRAVLLAASPFPLVVLQDYGGEALLRLYLFSLPFMAILGAMAFFPSSSQRRRWIVLGSAALMSLALVGGFFVVRYGNERFEYISSGEAAAVDYLTANLTGEATLVSLTSNLAIAPSPSLHLQPLDEKIPVLDARSLGNVATIKEAMSAARGHSFFYVSRGQEAYTEMLYGLPRGWAAGLKKRLIRSRDFRLIYSNPDAQIFVLADAQPDGG